MFFLPRALPSSPAEYHQLGAGEERRWWRVLLGLVVFLLIALSLTLLIQVVPFFFTNPVKLSAQFSKMMEGTVDLNQPLVFVIAMLSLVALIPAAVIATMVGLRIRPGYLFSVAGHLRWGWLLTCLGLAALIYLPVHSFSSFVLGSATFNPVRNLPLVLVLVVVLVPLQSAAEEITFRGYLAQALGALLPWRFVSLAVTIVLSAALFAAAHGSFHLSTFAALAIMAIMMVLLTWYTGGLEGAIAIHALHNTSIFLISALTGPTDSLVNQNTNIGLVPLLTMTALDGTATALIAWVWKRRQGQRRHDPKRNPVPTLAYLAKEYSRGRIYPQYRHLYPPAMQAQLWGTPTTEPSLLNPEEDPHEL